MVIFTGGGTDIVSIRESNFNTPVVVNLGNGMDLLYVADNYFDRIYVPDELPYIVEFSGDGMRDLMWIVANTFRSDVYLDGGGARDQINDNLEIGNVFLEGLSITSIEERFDLPRPGAGASYKTSRRGRR